MQGCDAVRDKLFAAALSKAGPLAGSANAALDMRDGKVVTETGKSAPLAGVFKAMQVGAIEKFVEFIPKGSSRKAKKKLHGGEEEGD
jgi:xanthine dehydrogenase YagR molybdenum-binding subunit